MESGNVESSSARKRQKVGSEGDGSTSKKAWRGDGSREYGQDPSYHDQSSYSDYTRKGYGNDAYSSGQKYSQQREGGDRYYIRDGYASNVPHDTTWQPREASPWHNTEYGSSANYGSAGWNNTSAVSGGRYRGDYPTDPYYAAGQSGFGRTNTRQEGYGYSGGGGYPASSLDHSGAPPSSGYYRTESYAASRYSYDYGGAYHDRFDERGYGTEGTIPAANRFGTTRGGKFGFANTFRAGNTASVGPGGNGKYANSFKARQYSFGAKKAAARRTNSSSSSAGSSDEAQAEEKEPEKPKLITDVAVKDFLTLRTNLLDFHVTMALLKLSLKPDLELRQSLIANTIAAPPVVPVPTDNSSKESGPATAPTLVRSSSMVDSRNKATPSGPGVLARSASAGVSAGVMVTPQLKRTASAQYGREIDIPSDNRVHSRREDISRPELVRRDSSFKEKTPGRYEGAEGSARKPSASSREASATFPPGHGAVQVDATATPHTDMRGGIARETSRERSAPRGTSRPRDVDAAGSATTLPPGSGARSGSREGGIRDSSRERPQHAQAQNPTAAGHTQQGQGFARGRSREASRNQSQGYGYGHHGQTQDYYDNYGYHSSSGQQYGSYDDRYGYDAYGAYDGYDARSGYGYPSRSGSGYGGAGYSEMPGVARRDHSRDYGGYNRYDTPSSAGAGVATASPRGERSEGLSRQASAAGPPSRRSRSAGRRVPGQALRSAEGVAAGDSRSAEKPNRLEAANRFGGPGSGEMRSMDGNNGVSSQPHTQDGTQAQAPSQEGLRSRSPSAIAQRSVASHPFRASPAEKNQNQQGQAGHPQPTTQGSLDSQSGSQSSSQSGGPNGGDNNANKGAQFRISAYSSEFRGPQKNKFPHQNNNKQQSQGPPQIQQPHANHGPPGRQQQQNHSKNVNQSQNPRQQSGAQQVQNQQHSGQGQGQVQNQTQLSAFQQYHQNYNKSNKNPNQNHHQNKFQKTGNSSGPDANGPSNPQLQSNQPHYSQQQHQQGSNATVGSVKSPVKKLAPGEAPPLKTPR